MRQCLEHVHIDCFLLTGAPQHTVMDSLRHAFLTEEEYDTDVCFCDVEAVVAKIDQLDRRVLWKYHGSA